MNFQQLRHFVVTAASGNILKAAETLNISQSGLSRSISALESSLGLSLFERSVKGVTLTEFGRRFLPRAELMINERRRSIEDVKAYRNIEVGSITIGINYSFAHFIAPVAIAAVLKKWPGAEITVVTDNYPGLVDRLRRGEIDFALSLYMAATMDLELRYEELFLVRTGAFARRGHPLTELPNVCPAQLAEHQWALISGASALSAFVSYFTQRALVPPTVSLQCASVALLSSVVAQSDLLTLLPESLIRSQNLPLKMLAIDGPFGRAQCGLIHRQSAVETPISRAIVKAISIAAKDLFAAPRSDEVSGGANASAASSAGHADFA